MNIAITGAGGFLGTELLRQLSCRSDANVTAFTFDFERERETFVRASNIMAADNSIAGSFDYSDTDVLINCAFPRNAADESFAAGLDFIQTVIEKAAADKAGAVINISSQSVYSQKRTGSADETTAVIPETRYAVGKYFSELFVNSICRNIRHTNLRMASLIGAGFNQRITNKFAAIAAKGGQISVSGGDQLFGFLDVRDAASGIITAALSEKPWAEAYNLGTNKAYTLMELACEAVKIGRELGFEVPEPEISGTGEWQNSSLNCTKFGREFSWQPSYDLEASYRDIFGAFKI